MIDDITIRKIKDAACIDDVAQDYVTLTRDGGAGYKGLCPFHDDHAPSFKVSTRYNIAKCFSCGWTGDPIKFIMDIESSSYADSLRILGRKYGIEVEGSDKFQQVKRSPIKVREKIEQPIVSHQLSDIKITTKRGGNMLRRWIDELPLADDERIMMEIMWVLYCIGTTKNGDTIWWQIDDELNIRCGKIMRYLENGHRDKSNFGTWFHKLEIKHGLRPECDDMWILNQCLFGQHLVERFNKADINVVESEKAALIMSIFSDPTDRIWVATGGMTQFSKSKLDTLSRYKDKGRKIIIHPDANAYDDWEAKVEGRGFKIDTFTFDNRTDDKCGIDDIIIERVKSRNLDALRRKYKSIDKLVTELQLEEV